MSSSFAPPAGPPPTNNAASNTTAVPNDEDPFDPPPAYTPSAAHSAHGETSLDAGPSRMDFSGPPPLPDRLTQNITGVGVGFGRRPEHELGSQQTGQTHYNPPPSLPPRQPSTSYTGGFSSPVGPPPSKENPLKDISNNNAAGPSRPPPPPSHPPQNQDLSPTEIPTPGRPLLWKGQLLVYPRGFWCHKCNNTGYKAHDPSNPHEADWKKYGKPYNSALSTSYLHSTRPDANASTSFSANFQRPLPALHQPPQQHNQYGHLPPPPGAWNSYPGHHAHQQTPYRPPPPPQHHMMNGPYAAPGQQIFIQGGPGYVPPGALVVGPGDPRIGGRPCYKCGGSGRESDFLFGFDVGRCYTCQGVGRIF
ncbi:uncharacterized protein L201_005619 [Kwoniella dendrophila CBS 6074]|uniref:Uncharacterized protein n=1 Tax=Kwoniella dendrophila CBS 6074 TaxID=1295534 RepID=A0AAX4K0N2_9TREE